MVCLILDPMLASQPCLPAFWVLTSLHLLSLLLKMFFIILVIFHSVSYKIMMYLQIIIILKQLLNTCSLSTCLTSFPLPILSLPSFMSSVADTSTS